MALDRVIHFDKPLDRESVLQVLRDYLGEAGHVVRRIESDKWFFAELPGKATSALKSQGAVWKNEGFERWFEVWIDDDGLTIDIMTRQQDEFVNAVAEGFAALVARFWEGRRDG